MTAEEFRAKFPDAPAYLTSHIESFEHVEVAIEKVGHISSAVAELVSDQLTALDIANMALAGLVSDGMSTIEQQVAYVSWLAPLSSEDQIAPAIFSLDTTINLVSRLSKSAYFTADHIIQSMVILRLCERGDIEMARKLICKHHWACKNSSKLIAEMINRK